MQRFIKCYGQLLVIILVLSKSMYAQVPPYFNYQGIARDAKGNPLVNQSMHIKISILPDIASTIGEYEETQRVVTNQVGLYSVQIGKGEQRIGSLAGVHWELGNKFIRVAIDPDGGNNFIDIGTTQLLSVPYAMYAEKAGTAKTSNTTRATNNYIEKTSGAGVANSTSQIFDNGANIGIGTASPLARLHINADGASILQHLRMQNTNAAGAGRFTLYSDAVGNYATFTKYGSGYANAYAGLSGLYPYANLLVFGNNGLTANDGLGRFLISTGGNIGLSLWKGGTSKLKFHIDYATERVGIGNNITPASPVHISNVNINDTVKFTNSVTGHTLTDGFEIRTNGNNARLMNRENAYLLLGTNNSDRVAINAAGQVGIGTITPSTTLDVNGQIRIQGGNPGGGKVLTSDANGVGTWVTPAGGVGIPAGTSPGQMMFWNGTQWVSLDPGVTGSILHMCQGEPSWLPCKPTVSTDTVINIVGGAASVQFTVNNQSSVVMPVPLIEQGVCWSTSPNPTLQSSVLVVGIPMNTADISGLSANTTYYVRAYATNSSGTSYGNQRMFTTGGISLPTVATQQGSIVFGGNLQCGGTVANNGGGPTTARGIYYATSPGVTNANISISAGSGNGSFTVQIPNPMVGQTYYWKAYAINSAGVSYGQEESLTATAYMPSVGDSLWGGWVYYVYQPGDPQYDPNYPHGLIVAPSNLAPLSCDVLNLSMLGVPAIPLTLTPGGPFVGTITGDLVLVNDLNNTTLGCSSFVNNVAGKIAVVTRGSCAFEEKANNALQAGASGLIICDNNGVVYAGRSLSYPGNVPAANIPVFLIDSATGASLVTQLQQNNIGTATMYQCGGDTWGCAGTSVTPDTIIQDGILANNAILSNCSQSNMASKRCDDLVFNGYSDWYLPARNELLILFNEVWQGALYNLQGNLQGNFWSSTQYGPDNALIVTEANLSNSYYSRKFYKYNIRPIRRF